MKSTKLTWLRSCDRFLICCRIARAWHKDECDDLLECNRIIAWMMLIKLMMKWQEERARRAWAAKRPQTLVQTQRRQGSPETFEASLASPAAIWTNGKSGILMVWLRGLDSTVPGSGAMAHQTSFLENVRWNTKSSKYTKIRGSNLLTTGTQCTVRCIH